MKVYKSAKMQREILRNYDKLLTMWRVEVQELDLDTTYGTTHVIACGNVDNPPLVLFHGVGDDSALMWIYNAKFLSEHYRIYAIDTIGGQARAYPANYIIKSSMM